MSTDKSKADTDNRSNQLNPNNEAYEKSRQNINSNDDDDLSDHDDDNANSHYNNNDDDDFADNETYGDDWEFNHD